MNWSKVVFPIAAIFAFRMLGLFMLIPVFTLYAPELKGATPTLVGLALGIYGLSQGLLQIPFGMASDRFGRKPLITLGLLLFTLGSLVGAFSESIYGMILARLLQGGGAIGSVLIALMADLTPDKQRTRAMAVIGLTIGVSFSLAMVISPMITHRYHLAGIFYLSTFLALAGIILLHGIIPKPAREWFHPESETNSALFFMVLKNIQLQRLNAGIFCQHFILTATFFALPMILREQIEAGQLGAAWEFYLPLMVVAFILMVPAIILAEKKGRMRTVFLSAVAVTALAQMLLVWSCHHWVALWVFMLLYFVAFNVLEASLPSLISKQAAPQAKGTAMGIYSTSQFLGIFAGGLLAGIFYQWGGIVVILSFNALMALMWLRLSWGINPE